MLLARGATEAIVQISHDKLTHSLIILVFVRCVRGQVLAVTTFIKYGTYPVWNSLCFALDRRR